MKTMTCKQLGGACDVQFHAETFEEMVNQSKTHGMEMFQAGDQAHLKVMNDMKQLMQKPGAMQEWFDGRRKAFDALADNE